MQDLGSYMREQGVTDGMFSYLSQGNRNNLSSRSRFRNMIDDTQMETQMNPAAADLPQQQSGCTEAHIRSLRAVTAENFKECLNHPDKDPNGNIFTLEPLALTDDLVFGPSGNCYPKGGLRQMRGRCQDPLSREAIVAAQLNNI
jgi:hypothetical protein